MTIYEMASKAMLVEKKKLGCARGLAGKAGAPLRCEDGMEILNLWNAGQIADRVTVRLEGDTNKFSFFIWTLAEKERRRIAVAYGLASRGLAGRTGSAPISQRRITFAFEAFGPWILSSGRAGRKSAAAPGRGRAWAAEVQGTG